MGPIADRTLEHLLPSDMPIVRIRRLLMRALDDHAAGKPLPGLDPRHYGKGAVPGSPTPVAAE